jgi:protein phosphatase
MHNALTLQCPNPACQADNSLNHLICQQCQTFLPKRYLWAVGSGLENYQPGDRLGDRYHLLHSRVVLDTQPGHLPDRPPEIAAQFEVYLHLFAERLHVPQVYGFVSMGQDRSTSDLMLLEHAPIYPALACLKGDATAGLGGQVMPDLVSQWSVSPGLRQLNWLWQMAQLWQPLSRERVVSTLLNPDLLRVDGSCLRLLELQVDDAPVSLAQLGEFWAQVLPPQAVLTIVCDQLRRGEIHHPDQLLALLDRALEAYSGSQTRQIQMATQTDQGPVRKRNEDACYPASGTHLRLSDASASPLVIVCDGIGGHEGGNVASNLAITAIHEQLHSLPLSSEAVDPPILYQKLEAAALVANDLICQRNDIEERHERQRMGTTVVMGVVNTHDLYITHVGDSRAYRITRSGCYQVTIDDDVASREARLGFALYREALQQAAAGSLIQALGMNKSSFLHPTVQRFVVDEDCVFLLCSDGLSDYDRIEECWATEIVPLLEGRIPLDAVSRRLVEIANTRNGHDNVTVGLIYCQVAPGDPAVPNLNLLSQPMEMPPASPVRADVTLPIAAPTGLKTQLVEPAARSFRWLPVFCSLIGVAVMGGLFASLLLPRMQTSNPAPPDPSSETGSSPVVSSTPNPLPSPQLTVDKLVKVAPLGEVNAGPEPLALSLWRQPGKSSDPQSAILGNVAAGSVLRVVKGQGIADAGNWVQLKICVTSSSTNAASFLTAGTTGWQAESLVAAAISPDFIPTAEQKASCGLTSSPVPQ